MDCALNAASRLIEKAFIVKNVGRSKRLTVEKLENFAGSLKFARNVAKINLWVLHDKFGFGQQRLTKVQRELKVLIDNYNDGLFTAEELVNQLYEETGIEHIKF